MNQKPHILVANVFFAPFTYGGATIVAEQVARSLVQRGLAHVSAVSLVARSELTPYAVIRSHVDGIDNYLINMPRDRSPQEHWNNPEVTAAFSNLLEKLSPDLVHVHCIQELGIGILEATQAASIPSILSVHDYWWICERQFMVRMDEVYCGQSPVRVEACKGCVPDHAATKTRFEALSAAAARAEKITYPSRFALDLCEASGLAPGRGVVWENGVRLPEPDFLAAQEARRAKDPRLAFGFVGGPSQIKGWPTIRAAFKKLKSANFRVDLVDGSNDGSWWRGHDFSDLPGEWRVVPRFEQASMDNFYAEIDVLLFMSQWKETYGLAIREALARGIDVIQTNSGGTTEHGHVAQEQLITIGADPAILRSQLESALARGQGATAPLHVSSFEDQADAFADLMNSVILA